MRSPLALGRQGIFHTFRMVVALSFVDLAQK
jgi:hypothetical protein